VPLPLATLLPNHIFRSPIIIIISEQARHYLVTGWSLEPTFFFLLYRSQLHQSLKVNYKHFFGIEFSDYGTTTVSKLILRSIMVVPFKNISLRLNSLAKHI